MWKIWLEMLITERIIAIDVEKSVQIWRTKDVFIRQKRRKIPCGNGGDGGESAGSNFLYGVFLWRIWEDCSTDL